MIELFKILVLCIVFFVAGALITQWEQKRQSRHRRRALEARLRRDSQRYQRDLAEGRNILPLHPGVPWYEHPDEQEVMRRAGLTVEDIRRAMEALRQ